MVTIPDPNPYPFVPIVGGDLSEEGCNVAAYGEFIAQWIECEPTDTGCPQEKYDDYLTARTGCQV